MKVLFKSISIRNFLSIGNDPVTVQFKPGLHIITGINKDKEDRRNGVGKSAIADAIYFAVFGNTIRELKKEDIVNNLTRADCEVILDFLIIGTDKQETEYRITRTLEPSRCEFHINSQDKTRDSIPNTTDLILRTLNTTPEVFENCVLMSVNSTIPFMAKKKVEKRKFIESVFNLEVFGTMLSNLKSEINEARRSFDVVSTRYDEINKSLTTIKKQQETFATDRRARLDKLTTRKTNNLTEIDATTKKVVTIDPEEKPKILEAIKTLEDKTALCDKSISVVEKLINQNAVTVQFKSSQREKVGTDQDKCPVCLKEVLSTDQEHFTAEQERIQKEIDVLTAVNIDKKQSLENLKELRVRLRAAIQNQNNAAHLIDTRVEKNKTYKDRIAQLQKWNTEIDGELRILADQTLQLKDDSKEISDRLSTTKVELDEVKKKLAILDGVRFAISEEGVKSSIVKKMLQLFNSKIAYYLKKMDSNCICVFNEYFEEEIINEKGIPCSYFNFSGAERKSIDFACLFAFMDLRRLQGGVAYNINLYDELLDSSVDEKGLDLVIGILKDRITSYNECVMIISHRKESVKAATGDVICLEKTNGITRRVDYIEE